MIKETRTCVACRKKDIKNRLYRVVSKNGEVILDLEQKENARGIYICKDIVCINRLEKIKNISKVVKINATKDSIDELLKILEDKISWEK